MALTLARPHQADLLAGPAVTWRSAPRLDTANAIAGRSGGPQGNDFVPLAAALVSRVDPRRELLVRVDLERRFVHLELLGTARTEGAHGEGNCVVTRRTGQSVTVVATVELEPTVSETGESPLREANLALTWSRVPSTGDVLLDVAGTALIFTQGDPVPEEFRAAGNHPYSRYGELTPLEEERRSAARGGVAREARPGRVRLPEKVRERLPRREPGGLLGGWIPGRVLGT